MDEQLRLRLLGSKIKLIVSDLDGTLLSSWKEISQDNREAIREAIRKNISFSLCTGRIATMTEYYTKTIEIDAPIITANGAVVWDPIKKKPISDVWMDPDEVMAILQMCKKLDMDYCALSLGTSYFSKNSIRIKRFMEYNCIAQSNGLSEMQLDFFDQEFQCIKDLKIYKILIYDTQSNRLIVIKDFIKTLTNTGYTSSEPGLIDLSEIRVDKGYGMKRLAEYLGLSKEEICAFGDYQNDISMLDNAGFPIAMGNSCEELRLHARLFARTNEESGVAWAMRQYIL